MKRTVTGILAAGVLVFTACKKDDVVSIDKTNDGTFKVFTEGKITTVQNLIADTIIGLLPTGQPYGANKFTFFSIENGALVASSDSATTKWDIEFRGTTILTNAS